MFGPIKISREIPYIETKVMEKVCNRPPTSHDLLMKREPVWPIKIGGTLYLGDGAGQFRSVVGRTPVI